MFRRLIGLLSLVVVVCVMPSTCRAQQQPTTTGSSSNGTPSGTQATSGSTTASTTTTTNTQGSNLTGQGVQQPQFRAFGDALNQNPSGFVGRGASDGFTGQQFAGQSNVNGNVSPQLGGLGANRGNTNAGQSQPSGPSRAARLRPRHRVAFSFSPLRIDAVRSNVANHINFLDGRVSGVETTLTPDGTLMLQGTAVSPDARKLAEALARLEPGVRRIDNQISVSPSPELPNSIAP
ncbi:MAG: BON domain-containing protein [Planctomycetaceae bacterium]|nr:BON domain-containing protein [Planctomycetaceae bacterium]